MTTRAANVLAPLGIVTLLALAWLVTTQGK
jgi:hypothetical protein